MSKSNLDGYPRDVIGKRLSVATHAGPAAYAVVVPGSPPSGGDTLRASEFGLKSFDAVLPMTDDTGTYTGYAVFPNGIGVPSPTCILEWFHIGSTGLEVTVGTNLSARKMRILAWGD